MLIRSLTRHDHVPTADEREPLAATDAELTIGKVYPPWDENVVQGVADVLGETSTGLTGPEIGRLLAGLNIPDPGSGITKRHRLGHALTGQQARNNSANCVIRFITEAMAPVRYISDPGLRTLRQDAHNETLVFVGLRVLDDGRLGRGAHATAARDRADGGHDGSRT